MLAGQMVAVQSITMDLLHEIGASGNRLQLNDAGTLGVKLLRTYVAQLEALKRYRSAGEQVPPLDTNILFPASGGDPSRRRAVCHRRRFQ